MQKHKQILESKSEWLLDSKLCLSNLKSVACNVFLQFSVRKAFSKVFLCLKPLTHVIGCFQIDWQQVGQQIRGRRKTLMAGHDAETRRMFVFFTAITCNTCTISNSSLREAYTGGALHIFCVISRLRFDNQNCFSQLMRSLAIFEKGSMFLRLSIRH